MPGIRPAAFLSSYFFPEKGMREWTLDRRPGKWIVNEKLDFIRNKDFRANFPGFLGQIRYF